MRRPWVACWAIALATAFAPLPAPPAEAAPASTAGWPVKPSTRAPRLPPPRLTPREARRPAAARAEVRTRLERLRTARAIAQALRGTKVAKAARPPQRPAAAAARPKTAAASPQRAAARRGTLSRLQRPQRLRRAYRHGRRLARAGQPPGLQATEPRLPPPPMFLGDLHVQRGGATLYAAYARGQVVGHLPAATIVTNMGREGAWYRVEAPNGAVGYVRAQSVGATPPPW
ncbi:MAG: hypothetical protein VKS61_00870 [Candidatus Sericytochromatia bacterium]|nr:hypothetical protein [Candidatus Sericytochromatia bacterium]